MIDEAGIRERYAGLGPHLDERGRRLFAAVEAKTAGHGGIAAVSRVTGLAPSTIGRGLAELAAGALPGRVRRPGGGRKLLVAQDGTLLSDLLGLVEPTARGDPETALRWTCKSLRRLADELRGLGHRISHTMVGELLKQQRFSLQANRKVLEGASHPDRDAQFVHIDRTVRAALAAGQPVISVDTKKKELVGDFKNAGQEWAPASTPEHVRVHDFLIKELGRAVPYGIYDLAANAGWVSVGMDHDTAAFAVQAIRRWWDEVGRPRYPLATRLVITADGGGSMVRQAHHEGLTPAAVEVRAAAPGQPARHRHRGPPSAARHQQMEQDRASAVLVHQPELAGQAARQLSGHHRPDRRYHHQNRSHRAM